MKHLLSLLLLAAAPHVASADALDLTPARRIPAGIYGTSQAVFTVGERTAELDLPCAFATVPHRPALDEAGTFTAEGTFASRILLHQQQHAGYPATIRGRLLGDALWIQVEVHGNGTSHTFRFGPLEFGEQGHFFRCL